MWNHLSVRLGLKFDNSESINESQKVLNKKRSFVILDPMEIWRTSPSKRLRNTLHKKMKFSITGFFSKCDQICRFLQIWSHLLKKSVMENLCSDISLLWARIYKFSVISPCFGQLDFHQVRSLNQIPHVTLREFAERTRFCSGCIFSNSYYLPEQKSLEIKDILMKLWISHVSCRPILFKAILHKRFRFVIYKEKCLFPYRKYLLKKSMKKNHFNFLLVIVKTKQLLNLWLIFQSRSILRSWKQSHHKLPSCCLS